mmetsp:Transcript_45089/g.116610  ORF Transcript_45089/g.116610 Transcript_45089/m.116610 type:complete len:404 (-) Transcript_45089:675-1886(-)
MHNGFSCNLEHVHLSRLGGDHFTAIRANMKNSRKPSPLRQEKDNQKDSLKEVNLRVLKRVDGDIVDTVFTSSHAVAYSCDGETAQWKKKDVEGSLFVCRRSSAGTVPVVILNRLNATNLLLSVTSEWIVEKNGDFLLTRSASGDIVGIWFYEKEELAKCITHISQELKRTAKLPEIPSAPSPTTPPPSSAGSSSAAMKAVTIEELERGMHAGSSVSAGSHEKGRQDNAAGHRLLAMLGNSTSVMGANAASSGSDLSKAISHEDLEKRLQSATSTSAGMGAPLPSQPIHPHPLPPAQPNPHAPAHLSPALLNGEGRHPSQAGPPFLHPQFGHPHQQSAVTASHVKRALEMVVADDRFLEILAEKLASALSETARHSHPPPAYHVSHPQHLQANVFPHSHPNHHH